MLMETWKDVVGYEGLYQVSDLGNVRSLDRVNNRGIAIMGGPRKASIGSHGYYTLAQCRKGEKRHMCVHSLVAAAFIGRREHCQVVNHISGVKTDNRLVNLEIISHSANLIHADRNGLTKVLKGSQKSPSGRTEAEISEMKQRCRSGESVKAVAAECGIPETTLYNIMAGRNWRHVP